MHRQHTVSIQLAIDVAERQGWDVVGTYAFPTMFGTRAGTWVLMERQHEPTGGVEYRVAAHYGESPEFDSALCYTTDHDRAFDAWIERCKRARQDEAIWIENADRYGSASR